MRLEILAVLGLVAGSCSAQNFYGYRYRRDYNGTSSTTNSTSSSTSTSLSSSSDTSSSSSSSSKSSISSSISGSSSSSKSSVSSSSSASSGSSTSSLAASYGNNSTLSNVAPSPVGPATASANSTSQLSVSSTASTANASTSSYTKTSYAYAPSGYTPSGYPSGNATSKTGPTGTGSSGRTKTTVPPNGTCGTATLNVLDASLDWWYTSTLYDIVSIYRATYNRNVSTEGWTLIANPTPFDVTSALETDACTSTPVFVTGLNITTYDYSCGPASTPAAAATTILTQTAYQQPNATTGNGAIPNVIITPPPATISIPKDGGYAQGTPFVYFSAYEIITKSVITYSNGSVGCGGGETNTYPMATPFSFEYTGADPDGLQEVNAGVTGDVNPAFLGVVNASNAVAGSWVAAPTVALVVQKVVAKEQVFAAAQITATQLETPSATLPSGFTSGSADTGGFTAPTGFTGHLESSETSLATNPTSTAGGSGSGSSGSGSSGSGSGSGSSGSGSGSGSGSSGSGSGSGSSGSGSSGSGSSGSGSGSGSGSSGSGSGSGSNGSGSGSGSSGSGSGGSGSGSGSSGSGSSGNGGAGGLISAIGSLSEVQPSPTNAAQVLSDAEQTFPASIQNPTAAAIVSGINGGSSSSGSGSGSSGSGSGGSSGSGSSGGASAPVIVVGGSTVTGNSATEFSLGPSATLTPGGTAVVAGTTLSLGSGSSGNTIVVNGQTQTLSSVAVTPAPALTIGGQTITANSASAFVIGGQTLTPGGVVTAGGSTISLAQGATAVVINGQTSALSNPAITPAPIITLNGQTFTASGASSEFVIDGQTLTPGGQITAEGSTISLAQGATAVVINGQTSVLSNPAGITPAPVLTLNGQTFTANGASDFVIDGQTLTPGGVITAEGSTISLAQGGTAVVINGVTSQLSNPTITAAPALTVGGQTYSLISGSEYIIDGQTLTPGGVITEDGTTISLGAGASFAVVNGVTENLSPSITGAPVLSVGGQTFTAINNGGTFIIDGETLTPGGIETVTIGGHVYILSLAPGASTVEIEEEGPNGQITGTIYESIARATVTLTAGAGAGPSSPSQTIQPALQGAASSTKVHLSSMLGSVFVAFSTLVLAIWL